MLRLGKLGLVCVAAGLGGIRLQAQSAPKSPNFLLEPNRPMVYLHVDHVGAGSPEEDGKTHLRVWVALQNNCTLPIRIRTYGAPAGDSSDSVGVMDVIVPRKIFKLLTPEQEKKLGPKRPMPFGTWYDVGSTDVIQPGERLYFSLPREHFSKRWDIHIPFSFDLPPGKGPRDDTAWGGYTEMFLSYSFEDLPESVQKTLGLDTAYPRLHQN
jgi:hypothetical protein